MERDVNSVPEAWKVPVYDMLREVYDKQRDVGILSWPRRAPWESDYRGNFLLSYYISRPRSSSIWQCEDTDFNRHFSRLEKAGLLDVDGDGKNTQFDASLIKEFLTRKTIGKDLTYYSRFGETRKINFDPKATRTTANEIISFIKIAKVPEE